LIDLAAFAEHLHDIQFDTFDEAVIEEARRRVFDTLLATLVGWELDDSAPLLAFHQRMTGEGEVSVTHAIQLYVALTRSTEVDDIDLLSCVTAGSVVVPTAVIAAADTGAGDAALLAAIVAGYEAMIGLGRAIGGASLLYKGIWPTYVVAPWGAATVAAKLAGLDARQTAHALALALARTSRLVGRNFESASPRFHLLGCAAAEGYAAAQAAAVGFTGDPAVLPAYIKNLGLDAAGLTFSDNAVPAIMKVDSKPFPTARQGLSAVQAFMEAKPEACRFEEIAAVEVFVPGTYLAMIGTRAARHTRIGTLLSAAYQMGMAVLGQAFLYDAARPALCSANLADFLGKVTFLEAPELDALFPRQWGARVRLRLRSGDVREATVLDPNGSAAKPFGWQDLRQKAERIFRASDMDAGAPAALQRLSAGLGRRLGAWTAIDFLAILRV
jgi:2-methylcitrate dehydratase PrpD